MEHYFMSFKKVIAPRELEKQDSIIHKYVRDWKERKDANAQNRI